MKPSKRVQANILFSVHKTKGIDDGVSHIVFHAAFRDMVKSSINRPGYQVRKLHEHAVMGAH